HVDRLVFAYDRYGPEIAAGARGAGLRPDARLFGRHGRDRRRALGCDRRRLGPRERLDGGGGAAPCRLVLGLGAAQGRSGRGALRRRSGDVVKGFPPLPSWIFCRYIVQISKQYLADIIAASQERGMGTCGSRSDQSWQSALRLSSS